MYHDTHRTNGTSTTQYASSRFGLRLALGRGCFVAGLLVANFDQLAWWPVASHAITFELARTEGGIID